MKSRRWQIASRTLWRSAIGVVIVATAMWLGFAPRDTWSSKSAMTRGHIVRVVMWAADYQAHEHKWPDPKNWRAILHDFIKDTVERRFFDDETTDAWKSPLECEVVGVGENTEFRCISFGPNRVYDDEKGDDVVGTIRNGVLIFMNGGERSGMDLAVKQ